LTSQIAERLIQQFDHEPALKARIAEALMAIDQDQEGLFGSERARCDRSPVLQ
jgi:hypothetical protein